MIGGRLPPENHIAIPDAYDGAGVLQDLHQKVVVTIWFLEAKSLWESMSVSQKGIALMFHREIFGSKFLS